MRSTYLTVLVLALFQTAYPQENLTKIVTPADTVLWTPNPTGAAFRSLFVPGWGQIYNKRPLKSLVYTAIEGSLIYGILREHRSFLYYRRIDQPHNADLMRNNRNQLTWYLAGTLIMASLDAFVDAHLYHFDVSTELIPESHIEMKPNQQIKVNLSIPIR